MKSYQTNISLRNTKKGFQKKANRIYLRSDIPCGIIDCLICDNSSVINKLSLEREVKIIDGDLMLSNMEAFENFDIFENSILFLSEYLYIKSNNIDIFNRVTKLTENKNIYIYPNSFNEECALNNYNTLSKFEQRSQLFISSSKYLTNHINSESFIIVTNNKSISLQLSNDKVLNMNELALTQHENDFQNFISFKDFFENEIFLENENNIYSPYYDDLNNKIKRGELFKGVINITGTSYGVVRTKYFNKEFIVENENLNRALHADIVCFEILPFEKFVEKDNINNIEESDDINEIKELEEEDINIIKKNEILKIINQTDKLPTAKIVGIIKRTKLNLCGTILNKSDIGSKSISLKKEQETYIKKLFTKNSDFALFFPVDEKYPPFIIRLINQENYYNKRIIVCFDDWNPKCIFPLGHFIKMLGDFGDVKVENEVILYEYNININPFTKRLISTLPDENTELIIEESELKYRKDLRDICVCSIDPPGCKDIDDALHARLLKNGNIEVGVHIADVTHYIKAGSEIDRIASRTCNTVYMVHKRTDMLPKVLTENLCSLVAKPRYAFSVTWEFDPVTLSVLKVDYFKSIIKSRASLTYEQANTIMNDSKDNTELALSIRYLNTIAKHLKNSRLQDGALVLASNELKFNVDFETNTINDIRTYATFETNSLVEEFMLLANVYVAEKIFDSFPSCAVLRRHPEPKLDQLSELSKLLSNTNGINIQYSSSKKLAESLDEAKEKNKNDPFMNKLVRMMVTRTMNQAKYINSSEFDFSDFRHYGLAMGIYTHFTSPIRRYCDVLVHRLLAASLDIAPLPFEMTSKQKLNKVCDSMNKQNRKAFFCSRESNAYSVFLYFSKYADQIMHVVIMNIDKRGASGISKEHGIETMVSFSSVGVKEINQDNKTIILNDNKVIKLFCTLSVLISVSVVNYRRVITFDYKQIIS